MANIDKVDLTGSIGEAYSLLTGNLGSVAIFSIAWTALIVAVLFGSLILFELVMESFPSLAIDIALWNEAAQAALVMAPVAIVSLLGIAAIAVSWHRLAVTGTAPKNPFGAGVSPTFRYLITALFVFIVALAPMAIMFGALIINDDHGAIVKTSAAPILLVAMFAFVFTASVALIRFSLLFPASAVGHRMTFKQSWALTRGNGWAIWWGTVACAFPFSFVSRICDKATESDEVMSTAAGGVILFIGIAAEILALLNVAGFLSIAYRRLTHYDENEPASHFT